MKINYFFLIFSFLLFSCSKEDIHPTDEETTTLPVVITHPVTDFSIFSLTVNGELVTETDGEILEVGFVIDSTDTPSLNTNISRRTTQLNNNNNTFSFTYESLPSSTNLHIRAYLINTDGISYGNEIIFTTLPEKVYNGTSIYLNNQQEVDAFASNSYTTVNTNIYIQGSEINNLEGLEDLVIIYGELYIRQTNLVSLEGLNNLKFCATTVQIESNANLNTLNGLNKLKKCIHFNIIDNSSLINLQGLDDLEILTFPGDLRIENNQNLENLSGLNSFKTIWDGSLYIMYNPKLNSIQGLSNLNFIRNYIYVVGNPLLTSLNGLENIISIESLFIQNNSNLLNINGLNNLETIKSALFIENNYNLNTINDFQNLTNIGFSNSTGTIFHLQINNNQNLTNLNGLGNINSDGKSVRYEITNNNSLSDFCGIKNLISNNNIFNFNISNNLTNPTSSEILNSCQ